MTARERIGLGLLMIARNPGTLLFLTPGLFLLLPLAAVFVCVWLLIKLAEIVFAKRQPPFGPFETPTILPVKGNKC